MTNWVRSARPGKAIDHLALWPSDLTRALRFYRDGIGLTVLNDITAEGDYERFFGVAATKLRSIFLGDAGDPWSGKLELVCFDLVQSEETDRRHHPYLLLSFAVDVRATAERITSLGFRPVDVVAHRGVHLGIARDPDGALIELVEAVPEPDWELCGPR